MAINTNYSTLDYTSLYSSVNNYKDILSSFSSRYTSNGTSSNTSSSSSYDFYGSISNYGVNTANNLSDSAKSFLTDAKSDATALQKNIDSLTNKTGKSAFDAKTATSSDKDKLSITSTDSTKVKDMKDMNVKIDQVATTQKNTSTELNAKDKTQLQEGTKTVEVETADGKSKKVTFVVKAGDTNEDVLKKMATALNGNDTGVNAKVNTKDGKTTLSVESNKTGITTANKDNFTLKDVTGGASNLVSDLKLNTVEQKAQDAKYSVNGGAQQTSKSNDVDLGNGVKATLKAATEKDKDVKVGLGKDTTVPLNQVRDLVNNFNGLLELAAKNKDDKKSAKLYDELNGLSKTYSAGLERLGITKNKDGYLQIQEDKMKKAADDGSLESFFKPKNSGYQNFGFTYGLSRTASNVSTNPSRYVTTAQSSQKTLSFGQSAKYESILGTGLLFNSYY